MGKKLNPVAGAGAIVLVVGVLVWLFVSMAIGIIIGAVGLVVVIVGVILSTQKKPPAQPSVAQPSVTQPPVSITPDVTAPNAIATPPVGQAKFCTGCGAKIIDDDSFCRTCGLKSQA